MGSIMRDVSTQSITFITELIDPASEKYTTDCPERRGLTWGLSSHSSSYLAKVANEAKELEVGSLGRVWHK